MHTNKILILWLIVYPQKWKYPCRLFAHPCHFLDTGFTPSNTCWRLMHPNPNKEGLAPSPSNQVRAELDGSYIAVPWKGYIAQGEIRGWESTKKGFSVLDVQGQKVVQTFFFWTISALCTSRCIRITPGRTAWRGLRKSHRRRSLSHLASTQGYWWPGMQKEAQEYVRKCDQCQRFAPNIHQPKGVLNPLSSP